MGKQAGIWVDFGKAIVVALDDGDVQVESLGSDVRRKHRSTGGVRAKQHFWHRTAISGRREQVKRENEILDFYRTIRETIERKGEVGSLLLLGPGEAKAGLARYLLEEGFPKDRLHDLETTESRLSIGQVVATVKEHFGYGAPRKALGNPGVPTIEA